MPLNRLDNFIKNIEGRILYVNPNDLDATDAVTNQGNSLTQPFKTIQRALIEAARFSYIIGNNNDLVEKTTILLFPGIHTIDNRPGYAIQNVNGTAYGVSPGGSSVLAQQQFNLSLTSNFDLTQSNNILYTFNSINGGVIVPRGTSIVGLDLRKTKIKPLYVPNPTDLTPKSAIFRITGACYFWQFSLFDADPSGLVYTNQSDFSSNNQAIPTFSHHKLTCFEYADGVNIPTGYSITDLDMYYAKLSNAFNSSSNRDIPEKYPTSTSGFAKQRSEWEIVGAFATDPITISAIQSGDGITASNLITVTTANANTLQVGTPVKINGVNETDYNISTTVQNILSSTQFTYLLPYVRNNLQTIPSLSNATVTIETDTVSGASPYIFNISMRSVWGMNGMHADGSKASGFRSMVVAQFTGVSLQKDDRAFVTYNQSSRTYQGINYTPVTGSLLTSGSSSTNPNSAYHLNANAIYRNGWDTAHIKLSNNAFIQIVSVFAIGYTKHFDGLSGADASITNSNSNFGEFSLASTGFKNSAFTKDDTAYVTSIVGPKAITNNSKNSITYNNVSWVQIDVTATQTAGIQGHLYLYGFNSLDNPPPNIVQGYRIGANYNEQLYVTSQITSGTINSATVFMTNNPISSGTPTATGTNISEKKYVVTSGPDSSFNLTIGSNDLQTGETVRIFSDTGDLPENINENTVYYAINNGDNNTIKIASSYTNATIGTAISIYGGVSLSVVSRVSDKNPNDLGSPIQWDSNKNQWFIHVNSVNSIYNEIINYGTTQLGSSTNITYIKRASDSRSLDEKIYKLRVVIPKESKNARDPVEGYVIQSSSSTNVRTNSDFNLGSITSVDYDYNRNPRFIATCSVASNTVTVVAELPHNLQVNDTVTILNVTDTNNTTGVANVSYNGIFTVASIIDDKIFTYSTTDTSGIIHSPGSFTNNVNSRTTNLPRFQRNDLQSNYYIYRNEVISKYVYGVQDGIYHLYVLNAKNTVPTQFTGYKYNQNVVNLYPQLDRDNLSEDPRAASSFALRFPLGQVATNDMQKSITRETTDQFMKDFGVGLTITSVSSAGGVTTLTFDRPHGLSGIATYSSLVGGSGHTNGSYYNVKLYNNASLNSWNGATAQVTVSGNTVTAAKIMAPGSGYANNQVLYFDTAIIGGSADAYVGLTNSGLFPAVGNNIQIAGIGTVRSFYSRIRSIPVVSSIPAVNKISIAQTSGDPTIVPGQYVFVLGQYITVQSSSFDATSGITTFTCLNYHGLLTGNRFRVIDGSNNNLGDYLVSAKNDVASFTAYTGTQLSSPAYIIKHGLSANAGTSDVTGENVGVRDVSFFANDNLTILSNIFPGTTQIQVSSANVGNGLETGIPIRFPLGTYIQIDNEIMRIVSSSLSGANSNEITVIRGVLGTIPQNHSIGSVVAKINPLPVEFRRPSIVRASNQTFEYIGYGPGNYSTSLPQLQINNLTDTQTYLAQAQQRSCGNVVYTGMNNNGDFYIGNKKIGAKNGTEVLFGIPIPTVRGENPSALSVIFDQVTIKQNLLVEGGNSNNILSQFDGPVIFNNSIKLNGSIAISSPLTLSDTTNSTTTTNGSFVTAGGVGIAKTLNVGGSVSVGGSITGGSITGGSITGGTIAGTSLSVGYGNITGGTITGGTITGSSFVGVFPSGTLMLFQQTSAPTGWTKQTTHNDKTLRVVSGSAGSGGSSTFSSVFAARTPSGSVSVSGTNSGGGVSSHTLTIDEIPAHAHDYLYEVAVVDANQGSWPASNNDVRVDTYRTGSTGGGQPHGHEFTSPTWSGSASFSGNSLDFAVQYVDLIIASKN